jgi:hypothetical protein
VMSDEFLNRYSSLITQHSALITHHFSVNWFL